MPRVCALRRFVGGSSTRAEQMRQTVAERQRGCWARCSGCCLPSRAAHGLRTHSWRALRSPLSAQGRARVALVSARGARGAHVAARRAARARQLYERTAAAARASLAARAAAHRRRELCASCARDRAGARTAERPSVETARGCATGGDDAGPKSGRCGTSASASFAIHDLG